MSKLQPQPYNQLQSQLHSQLGNWATLLRLGYAEVKGY